MNCQKLLDCLYPTIFALSIIAMFYLLLKSTGQNKEIPRKKKDLLDQSLIEWLCREP